MRGMYLHLFPAWGPRATVAAHDRAGGPAMAQQSSRFRELPERLSVSRSRGDNGTVVLALAGQLYLATTVELARHIVILLGTTPRLAVVVLDLTELTFLSLAGLDTLRVIHNHLAGSGIRLR